MNAAIWPTEFFTTDTARFAWPFDARITAVMFSTALPAIAAMTSPANARLMPSWSTVGASAVTNQSETNAAPTPPTASSVMPSRSGMWRSRPASCSSSSTSSAPVITRWASATATPPLSCGSARATGRLGPRDAALGDEHVLAVRRLAGGDALVARLLAGPDVRDDPEQVDDQQA